MSLSCILLMFLVFVINILKRSILRYVFLNIFYINLTCILYNFLSFIQKLYFKLSLLILKLEKKNNIKMTTQLVIIFPRNLRSTYFLNQQFFFHLVSYLLITGTRRLHHDSARHYMHFTWRKYIAQITTVWVINAFTQVMHTCGEKFQ